MLLRSVPFLLALVASLLWNDGAQGGTRRKLEADIGSVRLEIFAYRPSGCVPRGIILVFHGYERNARQYRDFAIPLADAACAFVLAPKFDAGRFSNADYQRGGVTDQRASIAHASVSLVPGLIAWAQSIADAPLPVMLLGHSAGAQFLARVAAYVPNTARVMVLANPSTFVMPDTSIAAPYGGGFDTQDPTWLAAYLRRPIVILSGAYDMTDSHNMANSPQARAQGPNRLARSDNAFAMAQEAARTSDTRCAWRHVIVPDTGHNAAAMFASRQLAEVAQAAFGVRP